jgi:hypothetical protein
MSHAPFTEADVNYLLKARRFIHSLVSDTTDNPEASILEVVSWNHRSPISPRFNGEQRRVYFIGAA